MVTLDLAGADASFFEIDGTGLYLSADVSLDASTNPILDVTVEVSDASVPNPPQDSDSLSIDVTSSFVPIGSISKTDPSWENGLARSAGESQYPQLWRKLAYAVSPMLGNTGSKLINLAPTRGKINNAKFSGSNPGPPLWKATKYGLSEFIPSGIAFPASVTTINVDPLTSFGSFAASWGGEVISSGSTSAVTYFHTDSSIRFADYIQMNVVPPQWRTQFAGLSNNFHFVNLPSGTVGDKKMHHYSTSYNGKRVSKRFDGKLIQDNAATGLVTTTTPPRYLWNDDGSNEIPGHYYYFYMWNRPLIYTEVLLIRDDPLAMFRLK